jgi:hypothetical protein
MSKAHALRRIKLAYGSQPMKFIVLLRDPIDRFAMMSSEDF